MPYTCRNCRKPFTNEPALSVNGYSFCETCKRFAPTPTSIKPPLITPSTTKEQSSEQSDRQRFIEFQIIKKENHTPKAMIKKKIQEGPTDDDPDNINQRFHNSLKYIKSNSGASNFKCLSCNSYHEDDDRQLNLIYAHECCEADVLGYWECEACGNRWDSKSLADRCCM